MKIALEADNGLYVTAEDGGGIDARLGGIALNARATEINAWETLEKIDVGGGYFALKTCNDFFITAEGGGGGVLRTDSTSIGVWEQFRYVNEQIVAWDGRHVLTLEDDGSISARAALQHFEVVQLEAPKPTGDPRQWKGSFCIPGALPGSPFGDGQRIWTPAYGCYDDHWRAEMRKAYLARGYTHFVYNAGGLPYGSDYPELADDPKRVERDLTELLRDGLLPVVCCTDDRKPFDILNSVRANAVLIPMIFPVWEMNGPLGNPDKAIEEENCKQVIVAARDAVPLADCWLHFTPGHGSISYANECEGWRWCQEHGTIGLLGQGGNKISNVDPVHEGRGFETTACRLNGKVGYVVPDWDGSSVPPMWEGMHQLAVKFEWGIYESYHAHVSEADLNAFTDQFMTVALHVNGFCDGGTVTMPT